ncbi:MAG TPA: hypothetical protein PLX56_04580 [bacterium]|nr:hypothetical protein [bacterium]
MKIDLISIHIKKSPQAMALGTAMIKAAIDSTSELKDLLNVTAEFYGNCREDVLSNVISVLNHEAFPM